MAVEHFFIVGAQRSGTTQLYRLLDEHPEIEMAKPMRPEPKFFLNDELYEQGIEFYRHTYFSDDPSVKTRGEKATSYIESELVARRIAESFPDAFVLFMLREPVSRAISNYWFSVEHGLEKLPMWEAFSRSPEEVARFDRSVSASPYAYLERGHYVRYLDVYERYFPRKQMGIFAFESFVKDRSQLAQIYRMLDVDDRYCPTCWDRIANPGNYGDLQLTTDQTITLRASFRESNAELTARYGIDIDEWE